MVFRDEIIEYINKEVLRIKEIKDESVNGLQIEGKEEVYKIVTGVSASLELFQKGVQNNADMIIVHHGLLWLGNPVSAIKGLFKERLKYLFDHNITLLAYHLPLDMNPDLGNNIILAKEIGLENLEAFGEYKGIKIGFKGVFSKPLHIEEVLNKIKNIVGSSLLTFLYGPKEVKKVGIVSGGASGEIKDAINEKLDLFITGEASEYVMYLAKEGKIHFVSAGHYYTEKFGIKALGEKVSKQFNIPVEFIDIPNPV